MKMKKTMTKIKHENVSVGNGRGESFATLKSFDGDIKYGALGQSRAFKSMTILFSPFCESTPSGQCKNYYNYLTAGEF